MSPLNNQTQQPQESHLRQQLMAPCAQNQPPLPLNMLQQQVELVPSDKLNGRKPYTNGNAPIVIHPEGHGFDPYSTTYPERKDEISYEWVC